MLEFYRQLEQLTPLHLNFLVMLIHLICVAYILWRAYKRGRSVHRHLDKLEDRIYDVREQLSGASVGHDKILQELKELKQNYKLTTEKELRAVLSLRFEEVKEGLESTKKQKLMEDLLAGKTKPLS